MTVLEQRAYEAIASMAKKDEPDYWERLKHQAAISAMQGLILTASKHQGTDEEVAQWSLECATALINKLKEGK